MEIFYSNALDDYIDRATQKLNCQIDTKAYIQSIFKEFIISANDLSKESISILYVQAKLEWNFDKLRNIGDWLFYTKILYPQIKISSDSYYDGIAQGSYNMCYRILNKKWPLFQELSDQYLVFTTQIQDNIKSLNLP